MPPAVEALTSRLAPSLALAFRAGRPPGPAHMQSRRARVPPRDTAEIRRPAAGEDAQHGAAMLRLALELKKAGAPAVDVLVSQVARSMHLHEPSFRRFLAQQGDFFTALATDRD